MPKVAIRPLAELFRASVLKMLKDEGRLDDTLIKKILTWRHNSGFSVHNEVRLQAGDDKGIENVAQYIIRNSISLAKLSYIEKTGTVIYRSKMSRGGNKLNFQTFSPLEFIVAITQHILERLAQMVRYYGWYSNRMRGDRQRVELLQGESVKTEEQNSEVIVISNFRTKKIPPLVWRECIKKVWEVDPLLCSHCGGLMKIVSFIYEHRVIKKILAYLGLLRGEEQKRGPPTPPKKCSEVVVEPFDDGWPEYEESFTMVQG
jgi:hypothetical protein